MTGARVALQLLAVTRVLVLAFLDFWSYLPYTVLQARN